MVCLIKRDLSEGLEQFSDRADIECGVHRLIPLAAHFRYGFFGESDAGGHQLVHRVVKSFALKCIHAERVCRDHVAACRQIFPVDLPDDIRMQDIPGLGNLPRLKPALLQQSPHAAVEKQYFFSQ